MSCLVVVPTYNERDNLSAIIESIFQYAPEVHVLIVDDNSPDGTGQLADEISSSSTGKVLVIHRPAKEGLGPAYVQGFKLAIERGYDLIIQMDADFSHDPKFLPEFFKAIENNDVVIGSRYVNGISVVNWDLKRLILSKAASLYVRVITGMPFADCTAGFICWRREALIAVDLDRPLSNGYVFLAEMKYRAFKKGWRMTEVPIVFVERRLGQSKMSGNIMIEGVLSVLKMRLRS